MRKNSLNRIVMALTLIMAIGCTKDNESLNDQEITGTDVKTVLEVDDIAGIADTVVSEVYIEAQSSSGKKAQKMTECYEGVHSDTGFTLTFNECDPGDGHILNGTISVVYGQEAGSATYSATYTNFSVGDISINGTRSFTLTGDPESNSYSFSVTSDMTVIMENEDVISIDGTKSFSFMFGETIEDSTYSIGGVWTVTINNDVYSVSVSETLEGSLACTFITSGTMELSKNGLAVDVDFGEGDCDDLATLTYPNGVEKVINLDD
ncbi:hypothetical protein GGR42_000349 [Saonia flava]|uniref:Uncharacterized protein n=1 Tax=Saonia flava TaxID=523696 RepID=A0A846QRR3_9FLAO|nr:hypothetical protein [Saonia flava]NJB69887.1 hypothetical protein [Saonia flava]